MNLPIKHDDIRIPVALPLAILLTLIFSTVPVLLGIFVSPPFALLVIGAIFSVVPAYYAPTYKTIKSNKPKMLTESEERALEADVFSDYDNFIERLDAELEPPKEIVIVPKAIELIPVRERLNPNQVAAAAAKKLVLCVVCVGRGHEWGPNCPQYRSVTYY